MIVQERRKRQRVSIHFDVDVLIGNETISVQTLNISLTGVFCTSHPLMQKDAACKVRISLSDTQQITIQGKILRTGEQGTAISFIEMDEESFVQLMWCSTLTVTKAAPEEKSSEQPPTERTTGKFPSDSDKSAMLQAFGIPPEKCR
jgi:hypothetical protein